MKTIGKKLYVGDMISITFKYKTHERWIHDINEYKIF